MHSMERLKLEDVLGVWENDIYTLVITIKKATMSQKIEGKTAYTNSIIWSHISNEKNKMYNNTILISKDIYIYQLFEDNPNELVINYDGNNYKFHKVTFINEFKFYRSRIDIHQYIAIRWYNPLEYIALVEFHDFDIKRILRGNSETERQEICGIYSSITIMPDNWIEIEFNSCFPDYKRKAILETMKHEFCL